MSGIFAKAFERQTPVAAEKRDWESVAIEAWRSNASSAGLSVTPDSALRMSAVFACVRIVSETIASIPLHFYERIAGGKQIAKAYYLSTLFKEGPNPEMTGFEYIETIQSHLELWAHAYSRIVTNPNNGEIGELWPINPRQFLQTATRNGTTYYQFQGENGGMVWYPEGEIWHVSGFMGLSPIALNRRAIGLGLSAEEFGAKFFENDARPGIVLEHPMKLSDPAFKHLNESWNEENKGSANSHKFKILEEGMKLHEVGIPPEDAQFLETRKFQVQEIARIYRVPPHMLADLDRATFSNIEEQSIEFVKYSIMPRANRWEKSILKFLELPDEKEQYFPEFLIEGLERGNIQSRYAAYAVARQNGWYSANDIRAKENENPIEGGDVYLVPLNMVPADQIGGNPPAVSTETPVRSEQLPVSEERALIETRGRQAAAMRRRLASRIEPVFRDVMNRIMKRERNDVSEQARKLLSTRSAASLQDWLERFYREHAAWSANQITPQAQSYAGMIGDAVESELGSTDLANKVEAFVRAYADEFGKKESARSLSRLIELIQSQPDASNEELLGMITGQLDEWADSRPAAMAHEETVREGNAVALALYGTAGVTKIMSVATGTSSCPFCRQLDGKIIGIQDYFLTEGQTLDPKGATSPLKVSHNMRHSPYHGGCDCINVAAM